MSIKHLILGGARSGKSTYAEKLALELLQQSSPNSQLFYIATATAEDGEMANRISQHQARRDNRWLTIEEPIELADTLLKCPTEATILVDCLTLWLSNCLHQNCWDSQKAKLHDAVAKTPANVIFVSNEVGSGVVPMGELSRQFVDESGWLHQRLAEQCSDASLVVAGLPWALKRNGQNCHS